MSATGVSLAAYTMSYTFGVGRVFISLSVNTFEQLAPTVLVQQVYARLIARALNQPH